MQRETCSQCSHGRGNETTSCKVGCHGDSAEKSTLMLVTSVKDENEDVETEEVVGEQAAEERLLRVVVKLGTRAKIEVPMYEGNLNVEELLDWISDFDKYFDYEEIDDEKKVKHAVTRLKGHAVLWWDELQAG
jgi:hypothetical protein